MLSRAQIYSRFLSGIQLLIVVHSCLPDERIVIHTHLNHRNRCIRIGSICLKLYFNLITDIGLRRFHCKGECGIRRQYLEGIGLCILIFIPLHDGLSNMIPLCIWTVGSLIDVSVLLNICQSRLIPARSRYV